MGFHDHQLQQMQQDPVRCDVISFTISLIAKLVLSHVPIRKAHAICAWLFNHGSSKDGELPRRSTFSFVYPAKPGRSIPSFFNRQPQLLAQS